MSKALPIVSSDNSGGSFAMRMRSERQQYKTQVPAACLSAPLTTHWHVEYGWTQQLRVFITMTEHATLKDGSSRPRSQRDSNVKTLKCHLWRYLFVPATRRSSLGDRAFPVAAVRLWNTLPVSPRTVSSYVTFRRELKTFRTEDISFQDNWTVCVTL